MNASAFAAQLAQLNPLTTSLPTRRLLQRRARALGRCDLLPAWIRDSPAHNDVTPPSPDAICQAVDAILLAKIAAHDTPHPTPNLLQLLRLVYLRGLRTAPPPTPTAPPIPANQHAQARVNTFLAYLDGDPHASPQDADLVQPHSLALVR
jgi:hypothetical protein